ncbi:CgeB family protein [Cohnella fermenti]|uniref:Spore maturation protein cgeB n=1 Tax=Cohnella fermenti TaxID=2565925 RepID=A0A4S4BZL5_9BACL|nr:glycosyltransferase [Cohnella fermenti]THF80725.1 spore maturation protein cgeB [Cohnella fermenti]
MAIRKTRRSRSTNPYDEGYLQGAAQGTNDGRWQGLCEAILQATSTPAQRRPYHILYVASGKGLPYSPIDEGIVAALAELAERTTTMQPTDPVVPVALSERPDLVLVLDGTSFAADNVQLLRMHGIRTALWLTDDPYYMNFTSAYAPLFDYVFTPERNCVSVYQQLGAAQVFNLPLGVHPNSFRPQKTRLESRGDICFIGSAYRNRLELLRAILPALTHRKLHLSGFWWEQLELPASFSGTFEPGKWMEPPETAMNYSAHRISLNIHRPPDEEHNESDLILPAVSPNPRTFEISACGTLQIVDARDDIGSYYVPGEEIVTYRSVEELLGKLDYYLTHEEERQQIAWRALLRTMRDHTYVARVARLLDSVQLG